MKLTQAEWRLMNALWQGHPATTRDIRDRLPDEVSWAYMTVKTMLKRLVDKGALKETKDGAGSLYDPLVSLREARIAALKSVAADAFDGAFGVMMHFLMKEQDISPAEREELLKTLEGETRKGGKDD